MFPQVDFSQIDIIINKTIEAIDKSKTELFSIAEFAKREQKRIEDEFEESKKYVIEMAAIVKNIEEELISSKKKLLVSNKYYEKHDEEEKKAIYEKTDNLRIELAVKREMEQMAIKKRNELELRVRDAMKMVEKTDKLLGAVGSAMGMLTGDLQAVSTQLGELHQRQGLGIKIIKAQEDERQRIAREIHDGPAQSMSNVVLRAEICEKLMESDVEASKMELKDLKSVVKDSLQDVRRIIYNLRPMSLDDLGLIPTLQRYVNTFIEQTGILIVLRARGNYEDIKPVVSLTIFRIMQEALSNIKKYSNAKNVTINIENLNNYIIFSVADDGVGFDINEVKKKHFNIDSGFGLFSMRERVELLQGQFELNSEKGKGTKILVKVPINIEEGNLNE
ncbi:MAG: histidine kinase [Deltaproteobacteria bacterium]